MCLEVPPFPGLVEHAKDDLGRAAADGRGLHGASVLGVQDYGLSAMIAAWIGAVAGIAWGRYSAPRVVAGCLLCLGVGLAFRPTLTFLDSEHAVAFVIGIAVVRMSFARVAVPVRRAAAVAVASFQS